MVSYSQIPDDIKKIISSTDFERIGSDRKELYFSELGIQVLRAAFPNPDSFVLEYLAYMPINLIKCLITPLGLDAVENRVITFADLKKIEPPYVSMHLLSETGIHGLKTKQISLERDIFDKWLNLEGIKNLLKKVNLPTPIPVPSNSVPIMANRPPLQPISALPAMISDTNFDNASINEDVDNLQCFLKKRSVNNSHHSNHFSTTFFSEQLPTSNYPKKTKASPNSFFNQNEKLYFHLQAAISHTISTCVLGAGNRYEDLKRTNGWSFISQGMRSYGGGYVNKFLGYNDYLMTFCFEKKQMISKAKENSWYFYTPRNAEIQILLTTINPLENPLNDPKFNLSNENSKLLYYSMAARDSRKGQCNIHAYLTAKYLWENPSPLINKIECIGMGDEDHVFTVVNREGNINNPSSWGKNCWILDAWWTPKGKIFHASSYEKEEINMMKYFKYQVEKNRVMKIAFPLHQKQDYRFKVITQIIPGQDHYPTYDKYKIIDDYYRVISDYPTNCTNIYHDEQKHKQNFEPCLTEISKKFY